MEDLLIVKGGYTSEAESTNKLAKGEYGVYDMDNKLIDLADIKEIPNNFHVVGGWDDGNRSHNFLSSRRHFRVSYSPFQAEANSTYTITAPSGMELSKDKIYGITVIQKGNPVYDDRHTWNAVTEWRTGDTVQTILARLTKQLNNYKDLPASATNSATAITIVSKEGYDINVIAQDTLRNAVINNTVPKEFPSGTPKLMQELFWRTIGDKGMNSTHYSNDIDSFYPGIADYIGYLTSSPQWWIVTLEYLHSAPSERILGEAVRQILHVAFDSQSDAEEFRDAMLIFEKGYIEQDATPAPQP